MSIGQKQHEVVREILDQRLHVLETTGRARAQQVKDARYQSQIKSAKVRSQQYQQIQADRLKDEYFKKQQKQYLINVKKSQIEQSLFYKKNFQDSTIAQNHKYSLLRKELHQKIQQDKQSIQNEVMFNNDQFLDKNRLEKENMQIQQKINAHFANKSKKEEIKQKRYNEYQFLCKLKKQQ